MHTVFEGGGLTIRRIVEQEEGFVPIRDFLPTMTEEQLAENRSWLMPAGLDPSNDDVILCFQSYVVRTPHHTILVDTCVGNDKERPGRPRWNMKSDHAYMSGFAALGLSVEDIDIVVCTHLHADHVGWNTRLLDGRWVPTFPNARYVFSEKELAHWTAQPDEVRRKPVTDSVLPIVAAGRATLVGDGYEVDDHMRLVPTPGHTPHHASVLAGKGSDLALFTGDAIHTPLQARYPELSMFTDTDPALAARTRRSLLERLCDTPTLCCAAHFPSPSAGRITRWGDGFRCDPVAG